MTGLLKSNVIAQGLLGFAGLILLTAIAMQLTSDVDLDAATAGVTAPGETFEESNYTLPAALEDYAEIDLRPIFNSTRQPIEAGAVAVDLDENVKAPPLNAALAGVIIVEDRMIVVMQDNDTKQFVRTSVGAGMKGPFADWRVEEIGPRSVTLSSFDGESMQLDMQIAATTPAAPPQSEQSRREDEARAEAAEQYQQAIMNAGQTDNNESRAEEIRRRIAERRAQLQEAADQKAAREDGKDDDDI
jgi:hypothetical protein